MKECGLLDGINKIKKRPTINDKIKNIRYKETPSIQTTPFKPLFLPSINSFDHFLFHIKPSNFKILKFYLFIYYTYVTSTFFLITIE